MGLRPSRKKIQRLCREISELTEQHLTSLEVEDRVVRINRKMSGWANYFRLGTVSQAYRPVEMHACARLRRWLCRKHRVQERKYARFPDP